MATTKEWHPIKFLNLPIEYDKFAIVILNRPILNSPPLIGELWNRASIRAIVDGGANRWRTFLRDHCIDKDMKSPELLTGDFDSITPETMAYFKKFENIKIISTLSQDATDLTKALQELRPHISENGVDSIVVVADTSGRIDHILATIHTMFKARQQFLKNVNLYILSENSICWLLEAGEHRIHIPDEFVQKQYWCSFVPIGSPCHCTTSGFKWNLDNRLCQFGNGIVSTSNTYSSAVVTIKCNEYLYWSMGIKNDNDSRE